MQGPIHVHGHPIGLRYFAALAAMLALIMGSVGWPGDPAVAMHAWRADAPPNPVFLPLIQTKPRMGRIAFASVGAQAMNLVVMRADGKGTGWTSTGCNGKSIAAPLWAPDGQRIIFESGAAGLNSWLCAINADGSGLTTLAGSGTGTDRQPAWSPDGNQIVFIARGLDFIDPVPPDIYLMNADGTNLRQLTTTTLARDDSPAWSPDGHDIAFVTARENDNGLPRIYLMRADGSAQRRLTTTMGSEEQPAWSPDGEHIAFVAHDQSGQHVFVIRRDGTGQRPLMNTLNASKPLWSPDGTRIAYLSSSSIYVVNADSTGVRRLAETIYAGNGSFVSYNWSPDSQEIVFETDTGQGINLAVVRVDGGGQIQLTQGSFDVDPAWTR